MIQAFYTATSGMQAQQRNIALISNNISNINTPGYRIKRAEFAELLHSNVQGGEIASGYGTRLYNISTMPLPEGTNPFSLSIGGEGYFAIEDMYGNRSYTQNGDFKLIEENGINYLATQNDSYVLDQNWERIELDGNPDNFIVSGGALYPNGNHGEDKIVPAVVKFDDGEVLTSRNKDGFIETEFMGEPQLAATSKITSSYADELASHGMINQVNEITRLMQTQIAYQINSRVLQTADEMEGMANRLRG